jgi:hypothetical protein
MTSFVRSGHINENIAKNNNMINIIYNNIKSFKIKTIV